MAANGARRALQLSSSTGRILFGRSSAASSVPKVGKSAGFAFANESASSRSSLRRLTPSRICNDTITWPASCESRWDCMSDSKKLVSFHRCSAVFPKGLRYQSSKRSETQTLLCSKGSVVLFIYTVVIFI